MEALFKQAVEFAPADANVYAGFGEFELRRNRLGAADNLFQKALELDANNRHALIYSADLLLRRSDLHHKLWNMQQLQVDINNAKRFARRAWDLSPLKKDGVAAKAALLLGLIANFEGQNDQPALARLKDLLEAGCDTPFPEKSLEWLRKFPSAPKSDLYKSIADAISNPAKLSLLEDKPDWKAIVPIPSDLSWPKEAEPEDRNDPMRDFFPKKPTKKKKATAKTKAKKR